MLACQHVINNVHVHDAGLDPQPSMTKQLLYLSTPNRRSFSASAAMHHAAVYNNNKIRTSVLHHLVLSSVVFQIPDLVQKCFSRCTAAGGAGLSPRTSSLLLHDSGVVVTALRWLSPSHATQHAS